MSVDPRQVCPPPGAGALRSGSVRCDVSQGAGHVLVPWEQAAKGLESWPIVLGKPFLAAPPLLHGYSWNWVASEGSL